METEARRRIEVEVSNFGPIARANVDLRPLTVLVGPSNTGKSYFAILIYALHLAFNSGHRAFTQRAVNSEEDSSDAQFRRTLGLPELTAEEQEAMVEWLNVASSSQTKEGDGSSSPPQFPSEITELLIDLLRGDSTAAAELIDGSIGRCMGIAEETAHLIRKGSRQPATVKIRSIEQSLTTEREAARYEFAIGRSRSQFSSFIPDDDGTESLTQRLPDQFIRAFRPEDKASLAGPQGDIFAAIATRTLADVALRELVGSLGLPAYYLPADRTGVMHAHNVVVGALLDSAPFGGTRRRSSDAVMTGVLSDFLNEMIKMSETTDTRSKHIAGGIASSLEEHVLQGAVHARSTDVGHTVFTYEPSGWSSELPLSRTSSMVSELAPVVLYLKSLVDPGETVIIEEPESHLHPTIQAEFAIYLARLVKAGVRVVVTTHSEWILDQFSNLVRMSLLPESTRNGLPGADAALNPEDFGAWLFATKKSPKGTVVTEIGIDPEEGGLTRDYFDAAMSTHNAWAEIGNRLARLGLK